MTKKIFMTMLVALMALTATAQQNWDANRKKAIYDFASKLRSVNSDYAIMNYPVTYYDYYALTGRKVNGKKGLNEVMVMSHGEQRKFAEEASRLTAGVTFRVATGSELDKALHLHRGISSELGPNNYSTKGFYLSMDQKSYRAYINMKQQFKPKQ